MAGEYRENVVATSEAKAWRELTFRHALAKLAALRARYGSIEALGEEAELAAEAARRLGWNTAPNAPVAFMAGKAACTQSSLFEGNRQVVLVSGSHDLGMPDGWRVLGECSLMEYRPLGERCALIARRLGVPDSTVGALSRIMAGLQVAHVVGSRLCALPHPTEKLHIFVRPTSGILSLKGPAEDRVRDACMSVLGIGRIPLFAANVASLATVLFAACVFMAAGDAVMRMVVAAIMLASTVLGVALENWSARYYFAEDAREVVLDEVAGMSLALLFLPQSPHWAAFIGAFLLFRFFDIFKWGIHWVEKTKWPGSIVWDDLVAGLYAGLALTGIRFALEKYL